MIECEAYNYHRHGFDALPTVSSPNDSVNDAFQRNFANASPGGTCDAIGTSSNGKVICSADLTCDTNHLCGGISGTECFCGQGTCTPCGSGPTAGCSCQGLCLPNWQAQPPQPNARCGWPSHNAVGGDEGVTLYWSNQGFIENNVTMRGEGQQATGVGSLVESGVSLYEEMGVHLGHNSSAQEDGDFEKNNTAKNMLVVGPGFGIGVGVELCGNADRVENVTVLKMILGFEAVGRGVKWCQADNAATPESFTAENVLIVDPLGTTSGSYGAGLYGTFDSWSASYFDVWLPNDPKAYKPQIAYMPAPGADGGADWSHAGSSAVSGGYNPLTGLGPMVYVPASSNMSDAGAGGGGLGANVTCLFDHGANLHQPMWRSTDGVFVGCDWYASAGAGDIAASEGYVERCSTVHQRLNIQAGSVPGCSLP